MWIAAPVITFPTNHYSLITIEKRYGFRPENPKQILKIRYKYFDANFTIIPTTTNQPPATNLFIIDQATTGFPDLARFGEVLR